jgi:flagellar basal-body rod protein FlgB
MSNLQKLKKGWHEPGLRVGVMIDPMFQSGNLPLARTMLDASALRQDAIASNLANSDTPGYHRVDLAADFASKLKASWDSGGFTGDSGLPVPQAALAEDKTARSLRPDGNNVEIEHEMLAMNRNAVEFQYLGDVVTSNIKQLKMAISGTSAS